MMTSSSKPIYQAISMMAESDSSLSLSTKTGSLEYMVLLSG